MVRRELALVAADAGGKDGGELEAAHRCGSTGDAVAASAMALPMVCGRVLERLSGARKKVRGVRSIVVSLGATSWSGGCCSGRRSRASAISTLAAKGGLKSSGMTRATADGLSSMGDGGCMNKRTLTVVGDEQSVCSRARLAMPPWPTG